MALLLVLVSLGVLVYFINHVTRMIQLPEVIASIARDLTGAINQVWTEAAVTPTPGGPAPDGPPLEEVLGHLDGSGTTITAPRSGYLQFVAYARLVEIAADADAVVRLHHRPGHFVVEGLPLATVWPADASETVANRLDQAHVTGPNRTLAQDLTFAIDQLVEIAIRALSPAVNDTFTALTCIDWLGDGLSRIATHPEPGTVHRDRLGRIRLLTADMPYERFVDRSFDKIRQASRGMPAVMIRQLDALATISSAAIDETQRAALLRQAEMILRASEQSVPEALDREDVQQRYAAASFRSRRFRNERGSPACVRLTMRTSRSAGAERPLHQFVPKPPVSGRDPGFGTRQAAQWPVMVRGSEDMVRP